MAARWAVFWPPGRILARKSVFCYRTPDFVNGPFVALAKAVDLAPSDPFLNFSFPSYGRFRGGDPPTQQKVLPHLTVRALTDSNSPSALRARAGLIKCIFLGDLGLFEGDIRLTERQLSALKAASLEPRGDLGKVTYKLS